MNIPDKSLFYQGNHIGILLIHGLGGTPVEMKMTARGLHKAGYTVACCQLAGHCGTEEDLLKTTWHDWFSSVETALTALKEKSDIVFTGGLSMGAMLALHAAAKHPDKVDGALCFAPTLWYDGFSLPWTRHLLRPLYHTPIGKRFRFIEREPYGLKDERVRAAIVKAMFSGNSAEAGILGTPSQSLNQFWLMIDVIKKELSSIRQPVFIAHAREDDIASLKNPFYLQKHLGGIVETLVLDDCYHLVTIDRQRDIVVERAVSFINWSAEQEIAIRSKTNKLSLRAAE
jgi:carboxylesterase